MISYAQNGEDVVLARLFAGRTTGRYVDVGASDPVKDSVTKHFYDLGWRGINIEPIPAVAAALRAARPQDVTLQIALGAQAGDIELHLVTDKEGWSTTDDTLAESYRGELRIQDVPVRMRTLADVLTEYPGPVDFLKIDVEGAEEAVLRGADWTVHRPRVVVVEATKPGSPTPVHQSWDPLLVEAGYRCVLFDGLNRFYAQESDTEAREVLAAPANIFDDYETVDVAQRRAAFTEYRMKRAAEVGYVLQLEDTLREAQEGRIKDAEYVRQLQDALRDAGLDGNRTARYAAALEARIAELEKANALAQETIAQLKQRPANPSD
ncbi:MAG TPA: FkbM family methyltransferase [Pseudonocardiaceae bacterium]|nr:FkbM family methyltransferase [Pseudonocardiaceae bacterium]